jgi:hypothetical protein
MPCQINPTVRVPEPGIFLFRSTRCGGRANQNRAEQKAWDYLLLRTEQSRSGRDVTEAQMQIAAADSVVVGRRSYGERRGSLVRADALQHKRSIPEGGRRDRTPSEGPTASSAGGRARGRRKLCCIALAADRGSDSIRQRRRRPDPAGPQQRDSTQPTTDDPPGNHVDGSAGRLSIC